MPSIAFSPAAIALPASFRDAQGDAKALYRATNRSSSFTGSFPLNSVTPGRFSKYPSAFMVV